MVPVDKQTLDGIRRLMVVVSDAIDQLDVFAFVEDGSLDGVREMLCEGGQLLDRALYALDCPAVEVRP
jgi:hypothetical protein